MSVIGLVNQAVAWYAASAVLAFLFAMRKQLSGAIAGIGGAVASAMLVVAGGAALLMPERIHGGMLQFLHLTIRVGGVNALWLLAIGLSALPVSLFNISWHRHPQVKANGPLVNLLLEPNMPRLDLEFAADDKTGRIRQRQPSRQRGQTAGQPRPAAAHRRHSARKGLEPCSAQGRPVMGRLERPLPLHRHRSRLHAAARIGHHAVKPRKPCESNS